MRNKQVILLLSNISADTVIETFKEISAATRHFADTFFVYHQKNNYTPENITSLNHYVFTDEIFDTLPYIPLNERSIIPGCDHFPLLKFYLDNPDYEQYWSLEDDVKFRGNWNELFETYRYNDSDLISAYINTYDNEPNWPWWNTFGNIKGGMISQNQKIKSFNPIRRISNRGMLCLHNYMSDGWYGHQEVLMPTLFKHENFKIIDLGGEGPFVPEGFEYRFYDKSSHSYIPVPFGNKLNYIYHPIKAIKRPEVFNFKNNCVIAAIGRGSLHKKWTNLDVDFDLHLLIYDDSYSSYFNDSPFVFCQKGYKFKLIYDYLQKNPDYIEKYNYFFFPDDDIDIDPENISKLFSYMREYSLKIAQPALTDSYYSYEHTLKDKYCLLRYTNFVEMMTPCFSQDGLKKVLFTFNENKSGWGIEFHWAQLIGFTGREMAVIDDLNVIHTRPIQSFNQQNFTELNNYIEKYNLTREIKEYGFIPADFSNQTDWIPIISKRETYALFESQLSQIAQILLQTLQSTAEQGGLLEGVSGISLFFLNYYRLTGKRKYLDQALSIVDWSSDRVSLFKDDFSFSRGLPGFSWYIEYLAQNNFIVNDTDEILGDICEHLNSSDIIDNGELCFPDGIIGYGQHYFIRTANPNFDIQKELCRKEKGILQAVVSRIEIYYLESVEQKINGKTNYKVVSDCILFLCKTNQLLSGNNTVKSLITKLSIKLKKSRPSTKLSSIEKAYTLYTASKVLDDSSLQKFALRIACISSQETEILGLQAMSDIHLLNRLYQETEESDFKDTVQNFLEKLITSDQTKRNFDICDFFISKESKINTNVTNGLSGLGLILISAMADFKPDWDSCVLL